MTPSSSEDPIIHCLLYLNHFGMISYHKMMFTADW